MEKCENCGTLFPYESGYGLKIRFCTRKCFNIYQLKSPKRLKWLQTVREEANARRLQKKELYLRSKEKNREKEAKSGNCPFCGRFCKNQNSLRQHQIRCNLNPDKRYNLGGRTKGSKNPGTWKVNSNKKISEVCPFCKVLKETTTTGFKLHVKSCRANPNRLIRTCKEETKLKISKTLEGRAGGYRMTPKSTRSHRGYYKGLYCMSSWELAFVVYSLENGKKIQQCKEHFEYEMNGKKHLYTPDFIIDGIYYEIKNWHRPDTDFKINSFPKDKELILIEGKENDKYLQYAKSKYGDKFWENLYEEKLYKDENKRK